MTDEKASTSEPTQEAQRQRRSQKFVTTVAVGAALFVATAAAQFVILLHPGAAAAAERLSFGAWYFGAMYALDGFLALGYLGANVVQKVLLARLGGQPQLGAAGGALDLLKGIRPKQPTK